MDEISEVKKAIRHENWKRMYDNYQNSGMTVKEWCTAQGIPVKTFYYRLKVIRQTLVKENETQEIVPITARDDKSQAIIGSTNADDKIHITGNGIDIRLPMNISLELMSVILQEIQS